MVKEKKITITKDGPYLVEGNIPLREKINTLNANHEHEFVAGREFAHGETYLLCRCGHTSTPPFCDGAHLHTLFDGIEVASLKSYKDRAEVTDGPELTLLDDGRCALAKFCHRAMGSAWALAENSDDADCKEEAITAACDCPTGRLVAVNKNGKEIEYHYEPSIDIIQEPTQGVSSGIFVKGGIPLVSESGKVYETRNRYMLCRCGRSNNKPFCDASHVRTDYVDDKAGVQRD